MPAPAAQLVSASVAGIVLAGGNSSRMGSPKSLLSWGKTSLLAHVVAQLAQVADPILISVARNTPLPPLPSSVQLVYDPPGCAGPLAGLAASLTALTPRTSCALVVAGDMPWLPPGLLGWLAQQLATYAATALSLDGTWQPLPMALARRLAPLATGLAAQPTAGLRTLLDKAGAHAIAADQWQQADPEFRALISLNTPAAYTAALAQKEQQEQAT